MYRIVSILLDVVIASTFVIPIEVALQAILFPKRNFKQRILVIMFSLYLVALFSAVGIPDIRSITVDYSFNFIPFVDIFSDTVSYVRNEILNILLFVPMGILLPMIWGKETFNVKSIAMFSFGLSCIIESMQIFTFRLTDIDDLITNLIGALLGYGLLKLLKKGMWKKFKCTEGKISNKVEITIWFLIAFCIMFFISPYIR